MAHGAPDDSNIVKQGDVFRLDDMGELAARLGSPVAFIRSGDVLFLEDFACGINGWNIAWVPADANILPSNERVVTSGVSCYLVSGTGDNPIATLRKLFPVPRVSKLGLAVTFSIGADGRRFQFGVGYQDGTHVYDFTIRYDHALETLGYIDIGGAQVTIASPVVLSELSNNRNILKLVVDLETGCYERVYLNSVEYSLAGLGGYVLDEDDPARISLHCMVWGDGIVATEMWVDSVVLTCNEF